MLRRSSRPLAAGLLAGALVLTACGGPDKPGAEAGREGCIRHFSPDKDYFPVKSKVTHAANFSLRYEKSYQILTVRQPYPQAAPESYVLVKCGAPAPHLTGELAKAQHLTVPVRSLYSASTTQLPLLTETGSAGVLTGVADGTQVVSPDIRRKVDAGRISQYARGGTITTEKVIGAHPDVLVAAGFDDPQYPKLRRAGIPVVSDAEWLESTPLGRAEWIKAMAALTGTERRAGQVFDGVVAGYTKAARAAAGPGKPVKVLSGSMYQGTWFMAAGGSYVGRLIRDAGGTYPWARRTGTGSLQLGFETVYAKGGDARIWLTDQKWRTTADAGAANPRYAHLAAVTDGEVWTNTKALGPGGGNDFYQRGVLHPDLVLADLTAILHPDRLPGHRFTFYRKVPRG
ncbi:ABC transporter substrate-binding protein [Streptomyces pinistramenti]|uniref:ABC transporter substrate-binding protein n=1 Tax=Streptomyces pinistramenti TaxID=2884812 RepID=UPI001D099830|nr:ABC transporter substrate-binding protein [Streptomyces pinistramenti]MCB5906190.1 ABC transporter substrate-binding protein [Streptomyces pinistramenti]